jgi:hypothetical protein
VIVNEKAIKDLGFASAEEALGKRFWAGNKWMESEIAGVVKNFNVGSLHEEIKSTLVSQFLPYCDKVSI